ncbi:MAG: hypothetical protein GTO17_01860 [Candidatus Aminicenantes bacterium]|nr:hypothetical protein [Candidatus Aminicenantes bacterium]
MDNKKERFGNRRIIKYEKPKLVSLSPLISEGGMPVEDCATGTGATGNCGLGNLATGQCANGDAASTGCASFGNLSPGGCFAGSSGI